MTEYADPGPTTPNADSTAPPLLIRPREGRMLAGVCAGVAERWNLDLTLVRVAAVVLTLLSGAGLAAYLAVWLLTPSTDGPAPLRPNGRPAKWAGRLPVVVLVVLAVVLLTSVSHALFFGPSLGVLVAALVVAVAVGTRRGRWALLAVVAAFAVAVASVGVFGAHFGSRTLHVTNVSDLRAHYDYGVGTVRLDLTGVAVAGRHVTHIRVGRGDVDVTVPAGTPVVVRARSGVGSVTIDGHRVSGIDAEQSQSLGGAVDSSADELIVDVAVGVGHVGVHTATG